MGVVRLVEAASVVILALFVVAQPRGTRLEMVRDALLIGVGAVLGEETCIAFYRTYAYSPAWSLHVVNVPVMVGCIWPAVVLSARQVIKAITGRTSPFLVAALILFDATLVESVSVKAGLWTWTEGAIFDVPISGLVGWATFSGLASWAIDRKMHPLARLVVPAALTHVVLVTTWWGALKWILRAPIPVELMVALNVVLSLVVTARLWSRRGSVPLGIMGPRAVAAVLFFALVGVYGSGAWGLVLFTLPFALPYVVMTRWRPQSGAR